MKKMKKELKRIDDLLSSFLKIAHDYPKGGYEKFVRELDKGRAEVAGKIGRNKTGR